MWAGSDHACRHCAVPYNSSRSTDSTYAGSSCMREASRQFSNSIDMSRNCLRRPALSRLATRNDGRPKPATNTVYGERHVEMFIGHLNNTFRKLTSYLSTNELITLLCFDVFMDLVQQPCEHHFQRAWKCVEMHQVNDFRSNAIDKHIMCLHL